MFEAEATDFPFVAELPKREKSKMVKVWDNFRELARISQSEGMLLPQVMAAKVLGVSRGRVFQLVESGQLKFVDVFGERMVTENSILAHMKTERKAGRPPKLMKDAERLGTLGAVRALSRECVAAAKEPEK